MKTYQILILLVVMVLVSCRKDKTPPIDSECFNFPTEGSPAISYYSLGRFQYKGPYFNPNNSNEFVYHFRDNELSSFQLMKYNLQTKQQSILVQSAVISGQPKWSRMGWIAYTRAPGYVDHIFVLKDNGDSLRQFTSFTANHHPVWDSEGDYLYWAHSPVLGIPYFFLKKDLYGTEADTLLRAGDAYHGNSTFNDVSATNKLASKTFVNGNAFCIGIADLNTSPLVFTKLVDLDALFPEGLTGLCWSSDNSVVYFTIYTKGLYSVSIATGQIRLIIPFCHSKRYETISSSSDGKYIIGERIDSRLELNAAGHQTGKIIEKSNIYLIDLLTLKEVKIDLE